MEVHNTNFNQLMEFQRVLKYKDSEGEGSKKAGLDAGHSVTSFSAQVNGIPEAVLVSTISSGTFLLRRGQSY